MFAVLKTGGKQYKVAPGDILRVEKLAADAGDTVQFNDVLMIGDTIGTPLVDGAGVQAEVIDQIKGDKVIHYVRRRRKHSSQRTKGHRQQLTLLRVTELLESGAGSSGVKAAIGAGSAPAETRQATSTGQDAGRAADGAPKAEATKAEAKADAPKSGRPEAAGGGGDLKALSGVGPALEKKLQDAGVTSLAQVAAWTPEDVAEIDEKLSFKGRIEREGWIDQAKAIVDGDQDA